MSVDETGAPQGGDSAPAPVDLGAHPKGTMAIVGVYGILFLLGWLFVYFFVFLPRGPLTQ